MKTAAKLALLRESELRNERKIWDIIHDLSELGRVDREIKELQKPEILSKRMLEVFGESLIEQIKTGLVNTISIL